MGVRQNADVADFFRFRQKSSIMIDKAALYAKIEELQSILDNQDTAYDYEKAFDEKWREISQQVFQQSLGEVAVDRNKKKR